MGLFEHHPASPIAKLSNSANCVSIVVGLVLGALGFCSVFLSWSTCWSAVVVFLADVILVILLLEVGLRPCRDQTWLVKLPHRSWSILLLALLMLAIVFAFANMYVQSNGVYHAVVDATDVERVCDVTTGATQYERLTNWIDASYYSTVTITTLGYGDYFPRTRLARKLVVWQLGSGALLLLVLLPVLASRLSLLGEQ